MIDDLPHLPRGADSTKRIDTSEGKMYSKSSNATVATILVLVVLSYSLGCLVECSKKG